MEPFNVSYGETDDRRSVYGTTKDFDRMEESYFCRYTGTGVTARTGRKKEEGRDLFHVPDICSVI